MAAPTRNLCGILSRVCSRNNGLSQPFSLLTCSKLSNDVHTTHNCVHNHQTRCIKRHLSLQIRHYSFRGYRGKLSFDTPKKSQDFVGTLSPEERQMVLNELQTFEDKRVREGGKATPPIPPTSIELRQVLVSNAVPFIGFGFLDNAIMICAGDYIDFTIGTALCISTMAAAALGNTISDLAGIGLAGYVEAFAIRFGFQGPPLSLEQLDMNSSRRAAGLGRGLGIFIGCILGMFPLLFIKTRQDIEEETPTDGSEEQSPSADK